MNFSDYQQKAMRSAHVKEPGELKTLQNAALGLAGESGEVADLIKKASFQGHAIDEGHLAEEIGDILWYCALAATGLGMDLNEIAENNIAKLTARYPQGFDQNRSIHRE